MTDNINLAVIVCNVHADCICDYIIAYLIYGVIRLAAGWLNTRYSRNVLSRMDNIYLTVEVPGNISCISSLWTGGGDAGCRTVGCLILLSLPIWRDNDYIGIHTWILYLVCAHCCATYFGLSIIASASFWFDHWIFMNLFEFMRAFC